MIVRIIKLVLAALIGSAITAKLMSDRHHNEIARLNREHSDDEYKTFKFAWDSGYEHGREHEQKRAAYPYLYPDKDK